MRAVRSSCQSPNAPEADRLPDLNQIVGALTLLRPSDPAVTVSMLGRECELICEGLSKQISTGSTNCWKQKPIRQSVQWKYAFSPRRRQSRKNCLRTTRMKLRLINLAMVGPFAPMGRLYVDALFRRSIHPISSAFVDREHQAWLPRLSITQTSRPPSDGAIETGSHLSGGD